MLTSGTAAAIAHPARDPNRTIAQSACAVPLAQQIDRLIDRPEFQRSQWGILAQTLEANPQTLYARNADRYLVPASNAKLLTTAAALNELGPQFRIRTSVYQMSSNAAGAVLQGAVLQIVGRGDPSLTTVQLQDLAQQIHDRGITRIALLIGDDRYFDGDAVNPTWEWEDVQAGYGAPVNSLILNQNAIGLTLVPGQIGEPLGIVWDQPSEAQGWQIVNRSQTVAADAPEFVSVGRDLSQPILTVTGQLRAGAASEPVAVSIPQPGQNFLRRFQAVLNQVGIAVDRTQLLSEADNSPAPAGQEIAAVQSPPLSELLIETNQFSNNLYAEVLLRSLGITRANPSSSALANGITALSETLTRLGVDPDSYILADGSGLSRRNWVSPAAIVATLEAMTQTANASVYRASLSVAGISGTLQNRFRETPLQGQLQGKTGVLTGAVALSGYLNRGNRPAIVFSFIVNQSGSSLGDTRRTMDQIVTLLMQSESCER